MTGAGHCSFIQGIVEHLLCGRRHSKHKRSYGGEGDAAFTLDLFIVLWHFLDFKKLP